MAYFWDTFYVWFPACVSQAATDREPLSDTFLGHFLWLFLVTFFGYFSFMFDFPACVSQITTDRESLCDTFWAFFVTFLSHFLDTFSFMFDFPTCVSQIATDRESLCDTFWDTFWAFFVTFLSHFLDTFSFMFDFPACVSQIATDRESLCDTFWDTFWAFLWHFCHTFWTLFLLCWIFPLVSLKSRQTGNLRFRSSQEIGLQSHGSIWIQNDWKDGNSAAQKSKVRVRFQKLSFSWEGDMLTKCYVNGFDIVVQRICNFMFRPFNQFLQHIQSIFATGHLRFSILIPRPSDPIMPVIQSCWQWGIRLFWSNH